MQLPHSTQPSSSLSSYLLLVYGHSLSSSLSHSSSLGHPVRICPFTLDNTGSQSVQALIGHLTLETCLSTPGHKVNNFRRFWRLFLWHWQRQSAKSIGIGVFHSFLVFDGVTVGAEGQYPPLNSSWCRCWSCLGLTKDVREWSVIRF